MRAGIATRSRGGRGRGRVDVARRRALLWAGFVVAHALAGLFATIGERPPFGDVGSVYSFWARGVVAGGAIPGIDGSWVYPVGALVPILLPLAAGAGAYTVAWFLLVVVLDAIGFALLIARPTTSRSAAAAWWLATIVAAGPIGVSRLDAVAAAVAVVALLGLARRPAASGALLAAATWIKVWPAALVVAALAAARARLAVLVGALAVSVGVVVVALAAGATPAVLASFLAAQSSRGLEVEAPLAVPWLWLASVRPDEASVFYDRAINTFEIAGPSVDVGAALSTPLTVLAVAVVGLVAWRSVARGGSSFARVPSLALALVAALVLTNKVGSPQYVSWFIPPVVAGLVVGGRRFALRAVLVAAVAFVTTLDYPISFDALQLARPEAVAVVTLRSALLVVLYVVAVVQLARPPRMPGAEPGARRRPVPLREEPSA